MVMFLKIKSCIIITECCYIICHFFQDLFRRIRLILQEWVFVTYFREIKLIRFSYLSIFSAFFFWWGAMGVNIKKYPIVFKNVDKNRKNSFRPNIICFLVLRENINFSSMYVWPFSI